MTPRISERQWLGMRRGRDVYNLPYPYTHRCEDCGELLEKEPGQGITHTLSDCVLKLKNEVNDLKDRVSLLETKFSDL